MGGLDAVGDPGSLGGLCSCHTDQDTATLQFSGLTCEQPFSFPNGEQPGPLSVVPTSPQLHSPNDWLFTWLGLVAAKWPAW